MHMIDGDGWDEMETAGNDAPDAQAQREAWQAVADNPQPLVEGDAW